MENHVGTTNLDNDKFVIKKALDWLISLRKWMLLEQLCVGKITENSRDFLQLMNIIKRMNNIPRDGFSGQRQSTAFGSIPERGLKMPTSESGDTTVQGAGRGVK